MRYRNARPEDFDACISLLRTDGGFSADASVLASVAQIWLELLRNDAFASFQVFEVHNGNEWEIVAFRNSVFVSHAFKREYTAAPFPQVGAEIWKRVLNGHSPVLLRDEIAIANGKRELNLVIPHYLSRHRDTSHPETIEVWSIVLRARHLAHHGYQINNVTAYEVFGQSAADMLGNMGYAAYTFVDTDECSLKNNPSNSTVFYWGDKEKNSKSGVTIALIAAPCPDPQFKFTAAQQRLLRNAIDGLSDKEIAQLLGIRHDTIRRRWESIYKIVEQTDPSILPSTQNKEGQRGVTRRYMLLEYIRQHLEEVRPYKAPPLNEE